jgi:hypothetical protein
MSRKTLFRALGLAAIAVMIVAAVPQAATLRTPFPFSIAAPSARNLGSVSNGEPNVTVAGVRGKALLIRNRVGVPVLAVDDAGNVGALGDSYVKGGGISNPVTVHVHP